MSNPNEPQDPFAAPQPGATPEQPSAPAGPPAYGQPPAAPAYGQPPAAPAYGQAPGAPGYGQQQYGNPFPKNSLGVWSLVLSLVGMFVCSLLTSIPGIITGHMALTANKQGLANNRGMALAGVIIGWVATVSGVITLLWLFAFGGLEWYLELVDEASRV